MPSGPPWPVLSKNGACRGLEALAVQQLTPELLEPLRRAEQVIFVDASMGDPTGTTALYRLCHLESAEKGSSPGHTSDPHWLLALAQMVHGRHRRPGWSRSRWRTWILASPCQPTRSKG